MLEGWFIQKYQLPAHHPLFLEQPLECHLEEYMGDQFEKVEEIEARLKSGNLSAQQRGHLMDQLKALKAFLDDQPIKATNDPLAEYWEAQIARGEEPNMDLELEDLQEMGEL